MLREEEGRIQTSGCEINVTHHCNLSCMGCSHLSPVLKKHYISPDRLLDDLCALAGHYHVGHVRLMGGEPLMHPQLLDVIAVTRKSGIGEQIRLTTNGIFLDQMPDLVWQQVDQVYVSVYPGNRLSARQLLLCRDKASLHGVELQVFHFDHFRIPYSELGTQDESLVQRIYSTCQIAHRWRCHNICDGYFYKCPQGLFLPMLLGDSKLTQSIADRVEISDSPDLARDLLAYLESPEPLAACSYCTGSVGKRFPHSQVTRKGWRQLQAGTTESLLDHEYLSVLERVDRDADNRCLRESPIK